MKITSNAVNTHYMAQNELPKLSGGNSSSKRLNKNFDELLIHSNTAISDEKFLQELPKRISKELKNFTPTYQLEDIKNQIEDGTYRIGLDEVVKKMLLN